MTTGDLQSIEIDNGEAKAWMQKSLRQGFDLSSAVLAAHALDEGVFSVLAPAGFKRKPLGLGRGGVTETDRAQKVFGSVLDGFASKGAESVVVEDDMRRVKDPRVADLDQPWGSIGDRLVHWCDLRQGGSFCARNVRLAAHGYPLNAFLSAIDVHQLGLRDRLEAPKELPQLVASTLVAVVVSAFDGESFLIWTSQGVAQ